MNEENKRAVAAKCEAHARLEDLDMKETNIAYKEKRFNEEKTFLDSQIAMLQVTTLLYAFKICVSSIWFISS